MAIVTAADDRTRRPSEADIRRTPMSSGGPAARTESPQGPLDGVRVVEVSLGISLIGAGLAASLPGGLLRDLGADVARVQSDRHLEIDRGIEFSRVWNRGKEVFEVDPEAPSGVVSGLVRDADVAILSGPEQFIERVGMGVGELARANPALIAVRVRPSCNASGAVPDLELLVGARAGLPTQIRRQCGEGPVFPELMVGQAGAALSATVAALTGLYQRERTGVGCWAETSLYDGLAALLPMILGRVEHHSPSTRLLWQEQGPKESLCYRCADGRYIQLWFGAKGAYEAFLRHMGDPPSEHGYNEDLISGAMVERGARWAVRFETRDRDWWVDELSGNDFRCEPVLRAGEALNDQHVREVGLAVEREDPVHGLISVLGPVVQVGPSGTDGAGERRGGQGPYLSGVRVLDLSAYLAGPIAPLVLAELGADVVKVEPITGDVHRSMEPMFAAGQRGKRSFALDLKAPNAPEVLGRLFRWCDVVHHNSRVGLAERLGYDEATVRAANPDVVYSFASGFGERGPRALLPTNDQLTQALAGVEDGQGGTGRPPTFLVWGAVDVTGGWVAACGVLAGLYARVRGGGGQRVSSSLLGAGLLLKSGAFLAAGGAIVNGPCMDADQRGYGAAYRLYQGGDGNWFALAVPDAATWTLLREVVGAGDLPESHPSLRTHPGDRQPEERILESAFRHQAARAWVDALEEAGVPVQLVREVDRAGFTGSFVDDPLNRQLGRVVSYHWGDRGEVVQPRFPPRLGPGPQPRAEPGIAGLGEHTHQILADIGFDDDTRLRLSSSGTVPPP
jgi:crotonobetainyl-CoA:carnitine CoA-transferase CaiB-like acyl-CoA transferase